MHHRHLGAALGLTLLLSCSSDPSYDPVVARQSMDAMRAYICNEIGDLPRREELLQLLAAYEEETAAIAAAMQRALHELAAVNADPHSTPEQFRTLFEACIVTRDAHSGALLDILEAMKARTDASEWRGLAALERESFRAQLDRTTPYMRAQKQEQKS